MWRPEVLIYMGGPRGIATAKRDALFFRLCGIRQLIGVPDQENTQEYIRECDGGFQSPFTSGLPLEYECSRLVRCLAELGDAHLDDPGSWDLHLTQQEHSKAEDALIPIGSKPFLAVSVGTKMQSKDWGTTNWHALLTRLSMRYPNYALVLCGAPVEKDDSAFASSGWLTTSAGPVVNLCGLLSPRESAAVFARARVFIGHDSGPMHLAASVQTMCVAIFSARNLPHVWFPYGRNHKVLYHNVDCQGCGLETCTIQQKKCIYSITVEEVLLAVASQLDHNSSSGNRSEQRYSN